MRCVSLLVALFLPCLPAAAGNVLVVDDDGGPGVDFDSLVLAVQAAADGDVILVKDGIYAPTPAGDHVEIDGKSLVITVDEGHTAILSSLSVTVRNLAPNQFAAFRGLEGVTSFWLFHDNAGTVWLEELTMNESILDSLFFKARVTALDSSNVVINRCHLQGPSSFIAPKAAPDLGLHSVNSSVHVYDSTILGGDAFGGGFVLGANAMFLSSSFGFTSGTTATGGEPGGQGASLQSNAELIYLDSSYSPGILVHSGSESALPQSARSFEAPRVLRENQVGSLGFAGLPADLTLLDFAGAPGGLFLSGFNGTYQLAPHGYPPALLGFLPGTGQLSVPVTGPVLPPASDSLVVFLQGGMFGAAAESVLAGGSMLVILDAGF